MNQLPTVDLVAAAGLFVAFVASLREAQTCEPGGFLDFCDETFVGAGLFGISSVAFFGGGINGLRKRRRCREARREYADWLALSPEQRRQRRCDELLVDWRDADSPAQQRFVLEHMSPECRERSAAERKTVELRGVEIERERERERDRKAIGKRCERLIYEWRKEKSLVTKSQLYNRLPDECKNTVTRTADQVR